VPGSTLGGERSRDGLAPDRARMTMRTGGDRGDSAARPTNSLRAAPGVEAGQLAPGRSCPRPRLQLYTHAIADVQGEDVATPAAFALTGTI
jgi:hypothetical protein